MGQLYSIGEVLIDFIPLQKGRPLKDVTSFERAPGGAPANVAAAVAKYGGSASMITKIGEDAFGDFICDQLSAVGVKTDKVLRTTDANTGLAFVSLQENGDRDFSFYRNPSADLLLTEEEVKDEWFTKNDILHFCSVDLVESPMKQAHIKAIKSIISKGGIVSFDPNVRLPLWKNPEACKNTILDFIPLSHIVKISDEELEFITDITDVEEAISTLFRGEVKAIIYTKGSKGAELYLNDKNFESKGFKVEVQDTTGAGDAFIGGILFKLLEKKATQVNLVELFEKNYQEFLTFANASGALTTTSKGAISSLPDRETIIQLING
ncbi:MULTISPECIES: carbohydrate kinase [unclassified Bacillus (in: firmicutes)]|uniref:carbohydrate kinase family protein n=1 Tax=unclassified Bacillus (in: firmicutes) TaxID=185979 RepID=UPI0008EC60C5|nr:MULTISPECIES: carbohydrate kinase [unclassified Bacillus (in: firmicutes)]PGZ93969.1 carbohydrate kinase [Bacillus sp. AFS029533]SFD76045.1 fructokinase [Bacillus sp. UNCCL81]